MRSPQTRTASSPPSEQKPDRGVVGLGDSVLTTAEYFVGEDGVHVVRSLEFDVTAHADDLNSAISMFVDNADDYCSHLADLAQSRKATAHELETLGLLVKRLRAFRQEEDSDDVFEALLRKLLRKTPPVPVWRPQTTPTTSATRSDA